MRALLLLFSLYFLSGNSSAATLYLSPNGNDAWSGTLPQPNPNGTDGPLCSLTAAQTRWRKLTLKPKEPLTVVLHGGNYFLDTTFQISRADPSPLTFKAFPNEKPRVLATSVATNWRAGRWNGKRAFIAQYNGTEPLQALYVNGVRATRARWPKVGTRQFKDAGSNGKTGWGEPGTDHFTVKPEDFAAMGDSSGAEVVALHFWVESRLPVQSFNPVSGEIISSRRSVAPLDWGYKGVPAPYYVENARGALREPGEWIDDVPNQQIVYLPHDNEALNRTSLNAPQLAQLVRVEGEDNARINGVRFENITFAESAAPSPFAAPNSPDKAPAGSGQAAVDVGGAIRISRVQNVAFVGCEFSALGWYGLQISDGSEYISVSRCQFRDLGAGGLTVSGYDANGPLVLRDRAVQVTDCVFQQGGRVFPSATALLLRHLSDSVISHNSISDFYYTGISCGWVWGYAPSVSKNNEISHNHIWNIGQGALSDMGGIYLLGLSPSTRVENNWIHDVQSANYGGWGIYLDEGSSDVLVQQNVVARCSSNAFHQHYGQNNRIENNIFVGGQKSVLARTRLEDHLSFSLAHNILVSEGAPIYSGNLPDAAKNIQSHDNILWDTKGVLKPTQNADWKSWQAAGLDQNSRVLIPGFRNLSSDNFDLPPNSPVLASGFKPWNWRDFGPRSK